MRDLIEHEERKIKKFFFIDGEDDNQVREDCLICGQPLEKGEKETCKECDKLFPQGEIK